MRVAEIHTGPEAFLVLFAWVFAEQIGLPLPAAPMLVAAGAVAAKGSLNVMLVVLVALAASVLADYLWYRAGAFGSDAVSRFLRRNPNARVLRVAERVVARYGSRTLVFAKFVPGLSLAAPPLSGVWGMSAARFLAFDTLGSLIWAGGFTGIGYLFGGAVSRSSTSVLPHLCLWLCVASTLGVAGFRCAGNLWRKLRAQPPTLRIDERFVQTYNQIPAKLMWLSSLITGDPVTGVSIASESMNPVNAANPFFVHWMAVWYRKLVIAKALGRVATELKHSARKTALLDRRAGPRSVPPYELGRQYAVDQCELERAIAAIDVFPRCALVLTMFEGLSLEDTVILLDADKGLVTTAQAIGLTELARNPGHEEGRCAEPRVLPRPRLAEMQPAI